MLLSMDESATFPKAFKASQEVSGDENAPKDASILRQRSKKPPKRRLSSVMADIPDPKSVKFDPLPIPSTHHLILHLPPPVTPNPIYAPQRASRNRSASNRCARHRGKRIKQDAIAQQAIDVLGAAVSN